MDSNSAKDAFGEQNMLGKESGLRTLTLNIRDQRREKMDSQKISEVWPEWRVVRNIGNGRFGSVYEVERNQFGKVEKAAVKVLTVPDNRSIIDEMRSDGYDDASIAGYIDDDFKNVVDEYYLMRELSGHSNIVDCYDMKYVKHADGLGYDVFIRMELLTSLNEAVRNGLDAQTAEKTAT